VGLNNVNSRLGQIVKFFLYFLRSPIVVGVIFGAVLFDAAKEFGSEETLLGAFFADFAEFVECIDFT